jgi:hypothetical protein
MQFAQKRNRLKTHFSERIPVVKRRISVYFIATSFVCEKSLRERRLNFVLTFYGPVFVVCTTSFNIQTQYVLQTDCLYVLCMDLRRNSDYFHIQH